MSEEERQANVPYFIHEGMMERMDMNNKRMHSALRIICITLIAVTLLFVAAYTVNNMNWMRYARSISEGRDAGVHEQSNTSDHL